MVSSHRSQRSSMHALHHENHQPARDRSLSRIPGPRQQSGSKLGDHVTLRVKMQVERRTARSSDAHDTTVNPGVSPRVGHRCSCERAEFAEWLKKTRLDLNEVGHTLGWSESRTRWRAMAASERQASLISPVGAGSAISARPDEMDDNGVATIETRHVGARGFHPAGSLMPQRMVDPGHAGRPSTVRSE